MVRILSPRDLDLLKQMAPEFTGEDCSTINAPYKSLLPPVANHYATNANDFLQRIKRLSSDDLEYLVSLIASGEESLHCLPFEYFCMLQTHVKENLGSSHVTQITAIYTAGQ
jgi:hypothetical protein